MRRQSAQPSRRRSLAGIDIQMLLVDPLSQAGNFLVHEQNYIMTLEIELELIDNERDVLLQLERFFQMLGDYPVALEYSKVSEKLRERKGEPCCFCCLLFYMIMNTRGVKINQ